MSAWWSDAMRAASEMELARPCDAVPWELREGWGVAITVRTRRGQRRWAGPVEQGWEWLRRAAGEAPPPSSPAGHDGKGGQS